MNPHRNAPRPPYICTHAPTTAHRKNQKKKNIVMENRRKNTSNSQTRCKKHPKHQQSPGVCSICLGERLSQISTSSSSSSSSSSRRAVEPYCSSSSSSSLSSLSSSSRCSTSELSPVHHHHHRVRSGTGAGVKWSKNTCMMFGKSRSMAFVGELGEGIKNKSSSTGFWSKLLRPRSHKKKNNVDGGFVGFGHSRTMRERMFATSTRVY